MIKKIQSFFILLSKQKLNFLLSEIFYSIFGRQNNENPILSYGKAFIAGAYFGIVYERILQGCNDNKEEIKKKFTDVFFYLHSMKLRIIIVNKIFKISLLTN